MGKKCDFYIERSGRDVCVLKDSEVDRDTYRDYCYRDDKKKCPIYLYYEKNK